VLIMMKSMKCRDSVLTVFFVTVVLLVVFVAFQPVDSISREPSSKSVELSNQTQNSLTLTFTLKDYQENEVEIDGKKFVAVDFSHAQFLQKPGEPKIPYHSVVLGIPVGSRVTSRILETDEEIEPGVRLEPFPDLKKVDGWPESDYKIDQRIYSSTQHFPEKIVNIEQPAFFRDQQIVQIKVPGIRFIPAQNQIIKYKKIVIEIDFSGGQPLGFKSKQITSPTEEEFYKSAVLNYAQAKKWRKLPAVVSPADRLQRATLQSGIFYTITVSEEGFYRIDGKLLESNNIDLNNVDPAKIRLFNNGGLELPRNINTPRPDSLVENAILVEDGGDGRFDSNDFILFYGRGLEGWNYDAAQRKFKHYINHYDFSNIYWLSVDGTVNGKRMQTVQSGSPAGSVITTYQGLAFIEEELNNPLRSGLDWFGRQFATDEASRTQTYKLNLPNAVPVSVADISVNFVALNSGLHTFAISLNDNFVGTKQFTGLSLTQGTYLRPRGGFGRFTSGPDLTAGENTLRIDYSHSTSFGQAYLDWVEFLYQANLSAVDDEISFTVLPDSGLKTYRVNNFSQNPIQLFGVTDYASVRHFAGLTESTGTVTFTDFQSTDSPKRYIALTKDKYRNVQALERIEMKDIKHATPGAEFVIITHEDFLPEAQRLASFRENGNPKNQLITEVVQISDIYKNFSAGLLDPVGIRNFLQYTYAHWSPRPAYILLFGDGDYDPKNIIGKGDQNWIPTFQSDDTLAELGTRTTDSWFTYLIGNDKVMDMAIGRINAQTLTDARNGVDKIIAYETRPLYDTWRNTITLVADDELITGGRPSPIDDVHIIQTEQLVTGGYLPSSFDLKKIYLSEFPKVVSASVGGVIKPAARETLVRQINDGTLIVNFVGHGNSTQWAHEVVFQQSDNARVQNQDKLIFFVAATCDWALFDNPQRQSQAEELLLAEGRGAIAILSSARLVFSQGNAAFNRTFYDRLFAPDVGTARIGDAFVATRAIINNTINDEKFHIYGDPTLRLAMPEDEAVITSIRPDSILALSTMKVSGEVRKNGQLQSDFNGTAFIKTFDSEKFVRHVPEAGRVQIYRLPGNSIYRGSVPVQNGKFSARFIIPKDISYGGSRARISAYFSGNGTDGIGYVDNIKVSNTSSTLVDKDGPAIKLYFQGRENFTSGDVVGENVTLVAELADTVSGINIAGEIGHRITLEIDPNEETCISERNQFQGISSIDLTDLFRFNEGDFLRGTVEFPLTFPRELDIGGNTVSCISPDGEQKHTLVLKAWDNSNNSSTVSVEVMIVHEDGLVLRDVMNYPNPMVNNTTFTFISNQESDVTIKIYTISGQLIRTLEYPSARNGFNMVKWDGLDTDGDVPANGVYLYKVIARGQGSSGTQQKETVGRLAIIR